MKVAKGLFIGTAMYIFVSVIAYYTNINEALFSVWMVTIMLTIAYFNMPLEQRSENPKALLSLRLFLGLSIISSILIYIIGD
jgi:hypothetical protein